MADEIVVACAEFHNFCLDTSEPILNDNDDPEDVLPSDVALPIRSGTTLYARGKVTCSRQIALFSNNRYQDLLQIQRAHHRTQCYALGN